MKQLSEKQQKQLLYIVKNLSDATSSLLLMGSCFDDDDNENTLKKQIVCIEQSLQKLKEISPEKEIKSLTDDEKHLKKALENSELLAKKHKKHINKHDIGYLDPPYTTRI